jgi:hypothetical protein
MWQFFCFSIYSEGQMASLPTTLRPSTQPTFSVHNFTSPLSIGSQHGEIQSRVLYEEPETSSTKRLNSSCNWSVRMGAPFSPWSVINCNVGFAKTMKALNRSKVYRGTIYHLECKYNVIKSQVILPRLIHMLSHQCRKRSQEVDQVIFLIMNHTRGIKYRHSYR